MPVDSSRAKRSTKQSPRRAAALQSAAACCLTLDYLGESVRTIDEATAATREYVRLIEVIVASGIERNISVKLTQLGVDIDRATGIDNLRRILEPGQRHEFFVCIDMENSRYTDVTLEVFRNAVAAASIDTSGSPCRRRPIAPRRTSGG